MPARASPDYAKILLPSSFSYQLCVGLLLHLTNVQRWYWIVSIKYIQRDYILTVCNLYKKVVLLHILLIVVKFKTKIVTLFLTIYRILKHFTWILTVILLLQGISKLMLQTSGYIISWVQAKVNHHRAHFF